VYWSEDIRSEDVSGSEMEHPTSSELVSSPLLGIRIVASSIDFKPPRVTCREIGTVIIT